ncbi:hypothetical protein D3C86_1866420 [compost metagenome]
MEVLCGIEFDGAVPVTRTARYAGFFAEAGDAQFQRVAEAINAQLTSVLECLARLIQQPGTRVRFGAHGKQCPT